MGASFFAEHKYTKKKSEGGRWSPVDVMETDKAELPCGLRYVEYLQ